MNNNIKENIYAGVLGKIIGVYLGRPVEGWSLEAIKERFDEIDHYVSNDLNIPLIVSDDDISGTFGFFRVLEDNNYNSNFSSKDVGDTWLNYIVEDKTILWWGGLGRSTEHTAYLHLKNGITAPKSGSTQLNGEVLSQQIGAQIFIDAFAMANPNNPLRTIDMIKKAARVSHDDIAVDAACFLGVLESLAFSIKNLDDLLDESIKFVNNTFLLEVINNIRKICSKYDASSWREARFEISKLYSYDNFDGPCHIIPNHALVLMSLILAKDNFFDSIKIAASAAWDTDCNAGNVGCINGIRLGLKEINKYSFLRDEVIDRLLVVTSDGGSCVSDAVIETNKIIDVIEAKKNDKPRFNFEFSGSVQGFSSCPYIEKGQLKKSKKVSYLKNENGKLVIDENMNISTPTFIDFSQLSNNFSTIASPTLYEGQDVKLKIISEKLSKIKPYILYYNRSQEVSYLEINSFNVDGEKELCFTIPNVSGMPIFRFGFEISSKGKTYIDYIDWKNTPRFFSQEGMLMDSIWETKPYWFLSWVGSAKQFSADFKYTFCISHTEKEGIETIGTQDWSNYLLSTNLEFSLHKAGGIVVRAKGLKNYIALLFSDNSKISLIDCNVDGNTILKECDYSYQNNKLYSIQCLCKDKYLEFNIDGKKILEYSNLSRLEGSAGYRIDCGTMLSNDFIIERV